MLPLLEEANTLETAIGAWLSAGDALAPGAHAARAVGHGVHTDFELQKNSC